MREGSERIREQIRKHERRPSAYSIAEPFDGTAYDRQVSKIHELYGQRSQRMAEIVKEVAKDLPPEQRQVLAEVLKRPPSSLLSEPTVHPNGRVSSMKAPVLSRRVFLRRLFLFHSYQELKRKT